MVFQSIVNLFSPRKSMPNFYMPLDLAKPTVNFFKPNINILFQFTNFLYSLIFFAILPAIFLTCSSNFICFYETAVPIILFYLKLLFSSSDHTLL